MNKKILIVCVIIIIIIIIVFYSFNTKSSFVNEYDNIDNDIENSSIFNPYMSKKLSKILIQDRSSI